MAGRHYIIRGGGEGRERLRLLARVMRPTTLDLFARIGVRPGMACADIGCGGGDVTVELGRLVGPGGTVTGMDRDATTLALARAEAAAFPQLAFAQFDISAGESPGQAAFDLVYARFLLSHLPDPAAAVAAMRGALRPGGVLALEDVDFAGHFSHPEVPSFRRYVELYTQAAQRRGADPHIGRRLPHLLQEAGLASIGLHIVQPAGLAGEVALVAPITMENIAAAVIAAGLASAEEVDAIVADLYAAVRDGHILFSLPRVVQAWGAAR